MKFVFDSFWDIYSDIDLPAHIRATDYESIFWTNLVTRSTWVIHPGESPRRDDRLYDDVTGLSENMREIMGLDS
jgi:hypothetical protein